MYNYRLGNSGPYTYNYNVEDMNGSGTYGDLCKIPQNPLNSHQDI